MENLALSILEILNSIKPYAYIILIGAMVIGGCMAVFGRGGKALAISIIGGGVIGFILITASEEIAKWFSQNLTF